LKVPDLTAEDLKRFTGIAGVMAVIFGFLTVIAGFFLIFDPHETLSTVTVIIGILLLVDGVIALVRSIVTGGDARVLLAVVGALSAIAGLVLIKKPFGTLVVFALIVGIWLIVAGVMRLAAAVSTAEGRGANAAAAALDLIGGIVILAWPGLGIATLAVILGIVLVLRGAMFIAAGIVLRRVGGAVAAELNQP